jgi:hypothetical protein
VLPICVLLSASFEDKLLVEVNVEIISSFVLVNKKGFTLCRKAFKKIK